MNKQEKAAGYDTMKADRDKLALAVYDLVNHKFSMAVRVRVKDFDPDFAGGHYSMRMSMRGMPLFLVSYVWVGQGDSADVLTDDQIQEMYREDPTSTYARMMMHGRNELMAKHYEKQVKQTAA